MLWCCRGNPARARLSTRWRLRRAVDGALPCHKASPVNCFEKALPFAKMAEDYAHDSVIAFSVKKDSLR
ncbi:hypothetical protein AMEX_G8833 [Astyanax mexicanus]|uniref:Uncharacterized protein n=1 Tax=Astyanax mexicanus TaxID=7994 RepID=A0A8T2M4E2_ASTMX|nr:hypothetical protein AMEX_G8833 [Astyanax mexicanus]